MSHLISSPYFFHSHYSRGSAEMRNGNNFDPESTRQLKKRFAVESFLVRLPDRVTIHR